MVMILIKTLFVVLIIVFILNMVIIMIETMFVVLILILVIDFGQSLHLDGGHSLDLDHDLVLMLTMVMILS